MMFIARISVDENHVFREQPLKEHLLGTEKLAIQFSKEVNLEKLTGLAAILHDLGKYSDLFQVYIRTAVYRPEEKIKKGSVPHSFAGGHFLVKNRNDTLINESPDDVQRVLECIMNAIYSHHGQLKDVYGIDERSELYEKMQKDISDYAEVEKRFFEEIYSKNDMEHYIAEAVRQFYEKLDRQIDQIIEETGEEPTIDILESYSVFITKYIFSILIDADRTNSRNFEEQCEEENKQLPAWNEYEKLLNIKLKNIQKNAQNNKITELRQKMSDACFQFGQNKTGIYTLSIPTGGGKTLASLRFAFQHAQKYHKERIIYIVPFTTVIEQNAKEVKTFLPKHIVLEHHSNVFEINENEDSNVFDPHFEKWKNAKDNWDSPIIFTTMVQFLNTFFDGASRNTRRLHNLSNSIIIFDEVQAIPIKCISMFNETLLFLKRALNTTSILCTATQPALENISERLYIDGEIIPQVNEISHAFKRTKILPRLSTNGWETTELVNFIGNTQKKYNSILIILNTKEAAKKIFRELYEKNSETNLFHLSTNMCPSHRLEVIQEVRKKLDQQEQIICVSTQLIEAGVDISFDCVIRSLAGLDSIAQAAGRCNRHGLNDISPVFIINYTEENIQRLETIGEGGKISRHIFKDIDINKDIFGELGILSQKAMTYYFKSYYSEFEPNLRYPTNVGNLYELLFNKRLLNSTLKGKIIGCSAIKTVGKNFKVIDQDTHEILVPYKEGSTLISELTSASAIKDIGGFLKQAQKFTIQVYKHTLRQLEKENLIRPVQFGRNQPVRLYVLNDTAYNEIFGLDVTAQNINFANYSF